MKSLPRVLLLGKQKRKEMYSRGRKLRKELKAASTVHLQSGGSSREILRILKKNTRTSLKEEVFNQRG